MALTLAGAAFAFADNTYLTQTGTAITARGFRRRTAIDSAPLPGAGEVAWHFIFNGNPGTVNGHFAFSDGDQELASSAQGANQAWWIITDASVTLDGSATYTDGTGGNFNLSHTCVGAEATPTPTLPNETATPTLPVETATPTLPTNETPTPTLPQTSTIDQSNTGAAQARA